MRRALPMFGWLGEWHVTSFRTPYRAGRGPQASWGRSERVPVGLRVAGGGGARGTHRASGGPKAVDL